MRYIVTVDVVFALDRIKEYDVWEVQTLVDVATPVDALKQALSFSRTAVTWKLSGYRKEPIFHGVRSIHEPLDSAEIAKVRCPYHWFVTKVAKIDENQFQQLKSFQKISVPLVLIYAE